MSSAFQDIFQNFYTFKVDDRDDDQRQSVGEASGSTGSRGRSMGSSRGRKRRSESLADSVSTYESEEDGSQFWTDSQHDPEEDDRRRTVVRGWYQDYGATPGQRRGVSFDDDDGDESRESSSVFSRGGNSATAPLVGKRITAKPSRHGKLPVDVIAEELENNGSSDDEKTNAVEDSSKGGLWPASPWLVPPKSAPTLPSDVSLSVCGESAISTPMKKPLTLLTQIDVVQKEGPPTARTATPSDDEAEQPNSSYRNDKESATQRSITSTPFDEVSSPAKAQEDVSLRGAAISPPNTVKMHAADASFFRSTNPLEDLLLIPSKPRPRAPLIPPMETRNPIESGQIAMEAPQRTMQDMSKEASQQGTNEKTRHHPNGWNSHAVSLAHKPTVAFHDLLCETSSSPLQEALDKQGPESTVASTTIFDQNQLETSLDPPTWLEVLRQLAEDPHLAFRRPEDPSHTSSVEGWTALHIAALSDAPPVVVRALLLVFPRAASMADEGGRLPLHIAAASGSSSAILRMLIETHAPAVYTPDDRGLIPLHLYLRNDNVGWNIETLRLLLGQQDIAYDNYSQGGHSDGLEYSNRSHRHWTNIGSRPSASKGKPKLFRRGEHLRADTEDLRRGVFGGGGHSRMNERVVRSETQKLLQKLLVGFREESDGDDPFKTETSDECVLERLWEDDVVLDPVLGTRDVEMYREDVNRCFIMLIAWKRRKQRGKRNKKDSDDDNSPIRSDSSEVKGQIDGFSLDNSVDGALDEDFINPATLPAPPLMQLPLHIAAKSSRSGSESKHERNSAMNLPPPSDADILRIIIAAHPQALMERDAYGRTPLHSGLLNKHRRPDVATVELLLGFREAGFDSVPMWIDAGSDCPSTLVRQDYTDCFSLAQFSPDGRYRNPAMVPCSDLSQLPLHVVAEEGFHGDVVRAIYEAYPAAKYILDARRRTPFHCALRNVQGTFPETAVVQTLLDDRVAAAEDDEGKFPFDLMVDTAKNIPRSEPLPVDRNANMERNGAYSDFFHERLCGNKAETGGRNSSIRFLRRIRRLPPWLRREACETPVVQRAILDKISSPLFTAAVLFHGIVLAATVGVVGSALDKFLPDDLRFDSTGAQESGDSSVTTNLFRIQHHEVSESQQPSTSNDAGSVPSSHLKWLNFAIFYFSAIQTCGVLMSIRLSTFWSRIVFNIWSWIDVLAFAFLIRTYRAMSSADLDDIRKIGMLTVAFLWMKSFGYLSRWWYGFGMLVDAMSKVLSTLVLPAVVALLMAATCTHLLHIAHRTDEVTATDTVDGIAALANKPRLFFLVSYYLLLGQPLVDADVEETKSVLILVGIFTVLFLVLLFTVIPLAFARVNATWSSWAVNSFWVPMMYSIFLLQELACCRRMGRRSSRIDKLPRGLGVVQSSYTTFFEWSSLLHGRLEEAWDFVMAVYCNADLARSKWWYAFPPNGNGRWSTAVLWSFRLLGVVVVPLWLGAGLATLGVLWPHQIRRGFFRAFLVHVQEQRNDTRERRQEANATRKQMLQVKRTTLEQGEEVRKELGELKELLTAVLNRQN